MFVLRTKVFQRHHKIIDVPPNALLLYRHNVYGYHELRVIVGCGRCSKYIVSAILYYTHNYGAIFTIYCLLQVLFINVFI